MKITRVYQKVRKNATRKWNGSEKNGKPLPEDWSPGTAQTAAESSADFTPSTEFSDDGLDVNGLPSIPHISSEDNDHGAKAEPQYYRRSPRVVFFDEEVLVRRVRPVYQIGGKIDRRELWYQDDEYKEIMWKARRLVKRAHNDVDNKNNEKYCLRGLEHVTNSIKRRTKANLDGREAVLDEQCLQFQEDVFPLDDDKICSVYLPYTKSHRAEAVERANYDAEEVELYQQTPSSTLPPKKSLPSNSSSNNLQAHFKHNSSNNLQAHLKNSHSQNPHLQASLSKIRSNQYPQLKTPKTSRRPSLNGSCSSFASHTSHVSHSLQKSPNSPTQHKPGMVFTHINQGSKYPSSLKLEKI